MVQKSTKKDEITEDQETTENQESTDKAGDNQSTEITEEMVKFVRENAKTMTYDGMAEELGIKKTQVSYILQAFKKRMRAKVGTDAYEKRTYKNQKGKEVQKPDFSKPITEEAKKVEQWISENLSRPVQKSNMSDALSDDVERVMSKL